MNMKDAFEHFPIAQDKPFDFRKLEKKNGICHSLGY